MERLPYFQTSLQILLQALSVNKHVMLQLFENDVISAVEHLLKQLTSLATVLTSAVAF